MGVSKCVFLQMFIFISKQVSSTCWKGSCSMKFTHFEIMRSKVKNYLTWEKKENIFWDKCGKKTRVVLRLTFSLWNLTCMVAMMLSAVSLHIWNSCTLWISVKLVHMFNFNLAISKPAGIVCINIYADSFTKKQRGGLLNSFKMSDGWPMSKLVLTTTIFAFCYLFIIFIFFIYMWWGQT